MTRIISIIADGDGVKGRRFTLDCTIPTLVVGPNGSGKSARLAAPHLALGTHVGGSSVPYALGDVPADCGRVELSVSGEVGDGRPLSLTRVYGAKHEARLQVGDEPLVKDAKGVEAQLVAHLGAQRCQPTDLADFVALTAEKQAAMVARVAGVTLADPAIRADLDARLGATSVEYDDARGMPRVGCPDLAQLDDVRSALDRDGLDGAKAHTAEQKRVWQARRQEAEKARGRLVDLRREDLPPGSLADAQARERATREDLARVRETLASRDQAVRERQRAATRVEQARARLASLPPAEPVVSPLPPTGGAALSICVDETRVAREAANDARAVTDRALAEAAERLRQIDDDLGKLSGGACPTCSCTAHEIITAGIVALKRRRAVAAARYAAAERADVAAQEAADRARAEEQAAAEALRASQAAADRRHTEALRTARLAGDRTAAEGEIAAAEAALAALPPTEALGDLEGTRERLEGELSQAAGAVAQLAGFEEAERLRAANEADLDAAILARATWGALERTLGAYGVELARRAARAVCDHADRIVVSVYDRERAFAFRPIPHDVDEAPAWGFGLAGKTDDGIDPHAWRPYSALSDSEQIVCGVALTYAMQQLGQRPFRPVVLDRLEALETPRALRLLRVLAEEQRAGRLSLVLCAMRTDGDEVPPALLAGLDGSGIALVRATDDDPRARPLLFPVKGEAAPGVAMFETEMIVTPPETVTVDVALAGHAKVVCTGQRPGTPMTASAHRGTGCACGCEEEALAKKRQRVRETLAQVTGQTAPAGGEGEAA